MKASIYSIAQKTTLQEYTGTEEEILESMLRDYQEFLLGFPFFMIMESEERLKLEERLTQVRASGYNRALTLQKNGCQKPIVSIAIAIFTPQAPRIF